MGKLIYLLFFALVSHTLWAQTNTDANVISAPKSVPFEVDSAVKVLTDPDNRIDDTFDIPEYFHDSTRFWFDIYTQHPSSHSVLHDKENMALIYDVLDFSSVTASELNEFTKAALQSKYVDQIVDQYKAALKKMLVGQNAGELQEKIENALILAKLEIPKTKKSRTKFFQTLLDNFRAQTGQKDRIQSGINSYARYQLTIESYFKAFDVPLELQAIPFLESSFNVRAKSKVGASGVWQFMRWIGGHFMTIDRRQDGRSQPLMATASALHLLRQNLKILDRWDLAISAYNSGTKHLLKAKRQLETKKMEPTLANVLANYEHEHLGFASRNFYSSFLALTRALAYREKFYDVPETSKEKIHAFVSLCKIQPQWFFQAMKKYDSNIEDENRHFSRRYLKQNFPRGTILFTTSDLTERRYFKIMPELMPTRYPKNWEKLASNQSCSTK